MIPKFLREIYSLGKVILSHFLKTKNEKFYLIMGQTAVIVRLKFQVRLQLFHVFFIFFYLFLFVERKNALTYPLYSFVIIHVLPQKMSRSIFFLYKRKKAINMGNSRPKNINRIAFFHPSNFIHVGSFVVLLVFHCTVTKICKEMSCFAPNFHEI